SVGAVVNSTPASLRRLYSASTSSVTRNTVPANPFAINERTWSAVSGSITGGPGMAISTTAKSGWLGGLTVSQRKAPSSGIVTSLRISQPSLLTERSSDSPWSLTQSCAFLTCIVAPFSGVVRGKLIRRRRPVFSLCAVLRAAVQAHVAGRDD